MPSTFARQTPSAHTAEDMGTPYWTAFRARPQTEFMIFDGARKTAWFSAVSVS